MLLPSLCLADPNIYANVFGFSYHFKDVPENFPHDWNQVNPGLGLQVDWNTDLGMVGLVAGRYKDSYHTHANYFGGVWYKHINDNNRGWFFDVGGTLLLIDSPSYFGSFINGTVLAPLPFIAIGYERVSAQFIYFPSGPEPDKCKNPNYTCAMSDAVGLTFKVKLN